MQPTAPNKLVEAVSTGVIFLPPFLLANLFNIESMEIRDFYFQAVQSISGWANTFNANPLA
jgi:hypothetical protein